MTHSDSWRQDALCRHKHLDFWYPPLEADNQEQYYAIGREVCQICPVWETCLEEGKEELFGMWGGLTPIERTVFKEKQKKTALKPHGSYLRYRQGCRCEQCTDIHNKALEERKDIVYVPNAGVTSDQFDLFTILYKLLQ
jgi:hypothetical protein